jgi:hypothetical protein
MLTAKNCHLLSNSAIALIGLIVFAFLASLFTPYYHEVCEKSPNTGYEDCSTYHITVAWFWYIGKFLNDYGTAITAISSVVIAAFTIILGTFTVKLAQSTKIAAKATKSAVDALPVVERAYVYPVIVSSDGVAKYIQDAVVFGVDDPDNYDTPSDGFVSVTFRLKNYGKTPAIVKAVYAGLGVQPIGAEIGFAVADGTLGAMESTGEFKADTQLGITTAQATNIIAYCGWFCLDGTIEFSDIWGNDYVNRFTFTWSPDVERMTLSRITTEAKQDTRGD